jgi:hypothetical protein
MNGLYGAGLYGHGFFVPLRQHRRCPQPNADACVRRGDRLVVGVLFGLPIVMFALGYWLLTR